MSPTYLIYPTEVVANSNDQYESLEEAREVCASTPGEWTVMRTVGEAVTEEVSKVATVWTPLEKRAPKLPKAAQPAPKGKEK